jgi:hypothetical protein
MAAVQKQSIQLGELAAAVRGLTVQADATAAIVVSLASDNCSEKITELRKLATKTCAGVAAVQSAVVDGLLKIHADLELDSTARIEQVDVASQRSAEQGLQLADHIGGGGGVEPQLLWKSIGRTTASTRCKINEQRLRAVLGAPIDVSLDQLLEWLSTQLVRLDPGIKLRVDQCSRLKRGKTTICHRLSVKIGQKEVQKTFIPGGNPFFLHDADGLQLPYEMDEGAAKDVLNKWKLAVRGALAELMDIFSVESGWEGV